MMVLLCVSSQVENFLPPPRKLHTLLIADIAEYVIQLFPHCASPQGSVLERNYVYMSNDHACVSLTLQTHGIQCLGR